MEFGTTASTVAAGNHAHDFVSLTNVPPVLNVPVAAGASAAIVQSITVNAKSDCGNISPAPRLEVYVNGALIGGIDVTSSSYADTAPFEVNPSRYASEVAVAFANDNQNGGCDHNLYVDHVTLTTASGPITLRSADTAHAIYDIGASFFDNIDVLPARPDLRYSGALRFFLSPAPAHKPAAVAPSFLQPPAWIQTSTGPHSAWTPLWSQTITVPDAAFYWFSLQGHWYVSGGWCYATLLVDGVPAANPCNTGGGACAGGALTASTTLESVSHQVFFHLTPGTHSVAVAVVAQNTCWINGARVYYVAIPQ